MELSKKMRKMLAEMGRVGGKIGGKRRMDGMTPEERSALARKAVAARWNKAQK